MKNKIALFLVFFFAAGTLLADDPPAPPPGFGDNGGRRSGRGERGERGERGGRRGGGMNEMIEQLRVQYPDEVEELESLRGDRKAYFAKMQELRSKAGLSSPERPGERNSDREKPMIKDAPDSPLDLQMSSRVDLIKERDPDRWADIELLLATEPQRGWDLLTKTFEFHQLTMPENANIHNVKFSLILPRDVVRVTMARVDREIKRKFPAEFEELSRLRVTNPAVARLRFADLVKRGDISTKLVVPITEVPDIPKLVETDVEADNEDVAVAEEVPAAETTKTE